MNKNSFWKNKKVLITGHTGFKGSWLSVWLIKKGAKVGGISLKPNTTPSLFNELALAGKLQNNYLLKEVKIILEKNIFTLFK